MTLYDLFLRAAERHAAEPAIVVPGNGLRKVLTYTELRAHAECLAARLPLEPAEERLVAILLPRTDERLYVAQLAVWARGGAVLCLDPRFPDRQLAEMLRDAAPAAWITDSDGLARAGSSELQPVIDGLPLIRLDGAEPPPVRDGSGHLSPWQGPADRLAYVIYTSGTTGPPKGVAVEHRSVVRLIESDLVEFGLGPGDRVAQNSSAAYDSAVEETWLALSSGAALVVMDDDTVRLGPDVAAWLRRERITVFCPPPTLLRAASCARPDLELPELRLLYVGGEPLPPDIANAWAPGRRLENGYGPTECTVTALRATIRAGEPIHIGWPVPGCRAWILDDALQPVPDGEAGELCLGGDGLARGYLHSPELTATRFPTHPEFGRIYRTGDLARQRRDGAVEHLGRIDHQVKLRGYRIELEAVEAALTACTGVLEAACRIQFEAGRDLLAAYIRPREPNQPLSFDQIAAELAESLPSYMIPTRWAPLAELPRSIGGKLDRKSLPHAPALLTDEEPYPNSQSGTEAGRRLSSTLIDVLALSEPAGTHRDLFLELGMDSLAVARWISALREHAETAHLTVRDVYTARTLEALERLAVERIPATRPTPARSPAANSPHRRRSSTGCGAAQTVVFLAAAWLVGGGVGRWMDDALTWVRIFSTGDQVWLLPLGAACLEAALLAPTAILAVGLKGLLIGRVRPGPVAVWSGRYFRHWLVGGAARLIPWRWIQGTEVQSLLLRGLGARVGRGVYLHRGVDVSGGGWDLLTLRDGAVAAREASLRTAELDAEGLRFGEIEIGPFAVAETRSGLSPGAGMGAGSRLSAHSRLPEGVRVPEGDSWDGIPAGPPPGEGPPRPTEPAPALPGPIRRWAFTVALLTSRLFITCAKALVLTGPSLSLGKLRADWSLPALLDLYRPGSDPATVAALCTAVTAGVIGGALFDALVVRVLGRTPEGDASRWSGRFLRWLLKTERVDAASTGLSGTLLWPMWLRLAGARIGRDCEISTILDVSPDLLEVGSGSFFADGIYLAVPEFRGATVRFRRTRIGDGVFLGNHAVIPGGAILPDDVLIGISTVAPPVGMEPGTSWFGHPPFRITRPPSTADRALTHEPSPIRVLNRWLWELARFALPWPVILTAVGGAGVLERLWLLEPVVVGPISALALPALAGVTGSIALKWLLLGRVRSGTHPLWSCWCSRWDFLYVAWGSYAAGPLSLLEGTPMLLGPLRILGMRIGRGVLLGPGFAQVVDPDMLSFEAGSVVSGLLQAHTFEDRILKLQPVTLGRDSHVAAGAVLLAGSDIGAECRVLPHTVVLKDERLSPGRTYHGSPAHEATE